MAFISEMRLKIGPKGTAAPLHLQLGPSITIFVGPNNSGKSTLLREIYSGCANPGHPAILLDCLKFRSVDEATARADLELMTMPGFQPTADRPDHRQVGLLDQYDEIHAPSYLRARINAEQESNAFAQTYGRYVSRYLAGASRLSLLNAVNLGNMKQPTGLLPRLLHDNDKRALVRQRIFDQLGYYLALDIANTPVVSVRLGRTPPPPERNFDEPTLDYMRRAPEISTFSDGVCAYCGLVAQIHVGAPKVIMIDEPEAFLAPPLVHALGKELSAAALEEGKQIFVATHSSHFLMGAVAAGAPVNIVRFTYEPGTAGTARLLPASDLKVLMNAPLLRSANVLSALFYKGVVVGEADADRAFYQECNERLLAKQDPRGVSDVLFLNANGKDVIPMIIEPLRRLGIPAAAVVDLDVVKQGGTVWTRHMSACGLPPLDFSTLSQRRKTVLTALDAANAEWKREGGVQVLDAEGKASADALINDLDGHGMFVVRRGEIEAWLPHLNVPRSDGWLHAIFEAMGNDPTLSSYEQPRANDVWDFIGSVSNWLRDSNRRGIA